MKTITRIFLLSCICLTSCGKDSSTPEPTPTPKVKTKTELLTQKPARITKIERKSSTSTVWQDRPVDDCETDDVYTFKVNKTLEITAGTKCPEAIRILLWSFESNETKINIDGIVDDVELLNETTLVLTRSYQRVTLTFF